MTPPSRSTAEPPPWPAPTAVGPLDATVELPGSKSLSARALLLAAVAAAPTTLTGVLRSRDTDLMIAALTTLGARFTTLDASGTALRVDPAPFPLPVTRGEDGLGHVDCGLAGTVMRFVPPLAALADAPVVFDGDDAARTRPLAPLLEALGELGAEVAPLGRPGFLPVRVGPGDGVLSPGTPGAPGPRRVGLDASASSQFLSALLLAAPLVPGGLAVTPTGPVPSLTHVAMTVASLRERGVVVDEPDPAASEGRRTWTVQAGRPDGGEVAVEPDLSNAGPFLAAALVAGGEMRVAHWPEATTQAGDAWRDLLVRLGGTVERHRADDGSTTLVVRGTGTADLRGIDADLSAVGELAPTVAALAALASAHGRTSRLRSIAHLRGHETDRLAALVAEIRRLGGDAEQTADGLVVRPASLHAADLRAYADHRMATFAAVVGLALPGTTVDDVACTAKTLPDFPALWARALSSEPEGAGAPPDGTRPAVGEGREG